MSFSLIDGLLFPWMFFPAFCVTYACLTALPPMIVGIVGGWRMRRAWVGVVLGVVVGTATIPVTIVIADLLAHDPGWVIGWTYSFMVFEPLTQAWLLPGVGLASAAIVGGLFYGATALTRAPAER